MHNFVFHKSETNDVVESGAYFRSLVTDMRRFAGGEHRHEKYHREEPDQNQARRQLFLLVGISELKRQYRQPCDDSPPEIHSQRSERDSDTLQFSVPRCLPMPSNVKTTANATHDIVTMLEIAVGTPNHEMSMIRHVNPLPGGYKYVAFNVTTAFGKGNWRNARCNQFHPGVRCDSDVVTR